MNETIMSAERNTSFKEKVGFLPWVMLAIGASFYLYEYFLRISPSVMAPELSRVFHIDPTQLGVLSAFYYYIYTPMQLPVGILMDRVGPRRLLTLATIACVAGSYLFASSSVLFVAQMGRFLTGFGSAFAFVGALKLISIWFPPRYFATMAGLATSLGMLGGMLGDNFMTALVHYLGWKSTIIWTANFGIVLAALIWLIARDVNPQRKQERAKAHNQPIDFRHAIIGVVRLLRMPQAWIVGIIGALTYMPISVFAELWGIPFIQQAHHFTKGEAGFASSLVFLGFAAGGPTFGLISDKLRNRKIPLFWSSIFGGGAFLLLLLSNNLSHQAIYILLFVIGFFAGAQPIVFAIARDISPVTLVGTAIATANMLVMLGGVVFQPTVGRVLTLIGGAHLLTDPNAMGVLHAYRMALLVLPVGSLLSAVLALCLRENKLDLKQVGKRRKKA